MTSIPDAGGPRAAADLQAAATEAYRRNPYPVMIHNRNHPDRMATVARIAGMSPPDVRTARVLEVGTGAGLNVLALAQALPEAQFVGFDIDPDAIAAGRNWLNALHLPNARLEVLDLCEAADRLDGPFDYIIAHGVLAWVPPAVASALLGAIGRLLSPNGVAMVSFNAMPGGAVRMAMRDIMRRASADAPDDDARLAIARERLDQLAVPRDGDDTIQTGFRAAAREAHNKDARVLLHDELGSDFHPRWLYDVLAEAREHGLAFLGDLTRDRLHQALAEAGADASQAAIEAQAIATDDDNFTSFRRLLLIRDDAAPDRRLAATTIDALWVSGAPVEVEPNVFNNGPTQVTIGHEGLAALLRQLAQAWPRRFRVGDLGLSADLRAALVTLHARDLLTLQTTDADFAVEPDAAPVVSPLARLMVERGLDWVATLDHRGLALNPGVSEVVKVLDGRPDDGRLAAALAGQEVGEDEALARLVHYALLMAPPAS